LFRQDLQDYQVKAGLIPPKDILSFIFYKLSAIAESIKINEIARRHFDKFLFSVITLAAYESIDDRQSQNIAKNEAKIGKGF
jgi:hypothetical protein